MAQEASSTVAEAPADVRAREVEEQLTDDERFSFLISVAGSSTVAPSHDKRFPEDVTMCTSYTPGVPRLGVPALLMSDSSMGIVNLDFRPGDTATALPAPVRGPPGRQHDPNICLITRERRGPAPSPGADEHTR